MVAAVTNGTITSGGAAQDLLAAGHNIMALVFVNESAHTMRVQVGGTAAAGTGELVAAGGSATFNNLLGKQVSLYGGTTSDAFSFREAIG